MVDGCWSKLFNVVSGVLQGRVLGSLLFLLYTSKLFSILENKLISHADDSTLMSDVPSPKDKKIIYGQEPPSGESTTTECVVNYQLLAVIY